MMKTVQYQYQREKKQNPYIGFTSFQHFRNDALYSDLIVKPENNMTETEHVECYPVPDYVEENGREQGYYPDCSVVYIRILWKEFEPIEGEYNYAFIEDILRKAEENGQTVMFRLMPHSTRESDDVPDWLKRSIDCPARPKGARVKDSPSDPKFLEYFGRAIRKIGERFDDDPTLDIVDISLAGAWGEGSHVHLFTEERLKNFVDIYVDAYKRTTLIGQMSPPYLMHYVREKRALGWRVDCIGRPDLTYEMVPDRIQTMQDFWKTGHISLESYWWLGEWKRQGWDPDKIIETSLSWHVSTFNAKSLPIPFEWKDKIEGWVAKMGYHFVIDELTAPVSIKRGEALSLALTVDNVGVAPMYNALPLYVKLKGTDCEKIFLTDVDVRNWLPGKRTERLELAVPEQMRKGEYELQIGIGGYGAPSVCFATNAKQDGDYAVLTKVELI